VPNFWKKWVTGGFVILGGIITLWLVYNYAFTPSDGAPVDYSVNAIGEAMLSFKENGYVLPFEVISILLLAAMIAAIVIAKRKTPDADD
jgi:NADH-quinone oxidoreductase subunit J